MCGNSSKSSSSLLGGSNSSSCEIYFKLNCWVVFSCRWLSLLVRSAQWCCCSCLQPLILRCMGLPCGFSPISLSFKALVLKGMQSSPSWFIIIGLQSPPPYGLFCTFISLKRKVFILPICFTSCKFK